MKLRSHLFALLAIIFTTSCGHGDPDVHELLPVWTSNSIKAELYLPTYGEVETAQLATPIAVVERTTATIQQLADLTNLTVDRPFEFTNVICDVLDGYDVLYLVITDQDNSVRRFSQYPSCGISAGDGFYQTEANGFIDNQQICDFAMSFGIMGFLCSES